jgi:hypothetical protein
MKGGCGWSRAAVQCGAEALVKPLRTTSPTREPRLRPSQGGDSREPSLRSLIGRLRAPPRQHMGAPEVPAYLLAPPALGERGHRDLARRLVAVRRRAVLMVPEGERPHPRRSLRRHVHLEDATDRNPIGEHVEVVLVPLAGWAGSRCALKDQISIVPQPARFSCSKNSPAAFLASSSYRSASNKGSPRATSSGNVKSRRLTRRRSGEVSN